MAPLLAEATPRPRTSSLGWVRLAGAEACVGPRVLARAVEDTLGRTVFVSPAQAEVAVEGHVEPGPGSKGWRAVLTMSDAQGKIVGTRELASDEASCTALNESLTLSLAVMIDPEAALRPASAPRRREAPPPPPVDACGKPVPTWSWGALAGAVGSVGYLPGGAALGVTVGGFFQPPRGWAFELGGTLWPRREATGSSGQATDLRLAYGSLAVCPLLAGGGSDRAVRWRGCVGAQVGSFSAEGKGLDVVRQSTRWVANAATHVRMLWPFAPPLGLQTALGLGVPVVRESFVYADENGSRRELFQLPPVTAWAEIGLSVQFL